MQNSEDTNPTAQAIRKAYGELGMLILRKTLFLSQVIGNGEPCAYQPWNHLSRIAPEMLLQENPAAVVEAQARQITMLSWLTAQS